MKKIELQSENNKIEKLIITNQTNTYTPVRWHDTDIIRNEKEIGETIEQKIDRMLNNNEPITETAPLLYTKRSDGVKPETDIRSDRFDIALDATDSISKSQLARRQEAIDELTKKQKGEITENNNEESKA